MLRIRNALPAAGLLAAGCASYQMDPALFQQALTDYRNARLAQVESYQNDSHHYQDRNIDRYPSLVLRQDVPNPGHTADEMWDRPLQDQLEETIPETDSPFSLYSSLTYKSAYVAVNGFTIVDNPVVQSETAIDFKELEIAGLDLSGASASLWGNYNPKTGGLTEYDLYLSLTKPLSANLDATLGYALFVFPDLGIDDGHEFWAKLSLKDTPLNPSLYLAHDENGVSSGQVFRLHFDQDLDFGFPVHLTGRLVYNNHYFTEGSGLSIGALGLSLPLKLSDSISLVPEINIQKALDDFGGVFKDEVWGGITVKIEF